MGIFFMKPAPDVSLFRSKPIGSHNEIPVFSHIDSYVANYQEIANDHIAAIKPGANNPFIAEQLWKALEVSTRELVVKYCQPNARVLDVGVGLGRILAPLRNLDRYGIDISVDYLERARSEGIKVAFARIEDMPFVDQCFDLVVVTDVLEHVFDLNQCTVEILRVLKPGGVLIVRVPYKEDLNAYLRPDCRYEFIHLRSFDEASLRLHFCKIFNMLYLESAPVQPYLQGMPRLRVQLLPDESRQKISIFLDELSPKRLFNADKTYNLLRKIIGVSAEQFIAWIYQLRDERPDAFEKIADLLVLGIEINAVFQKPANSTVAPNL
jgi:SAM-dependent methyltransferase